MKRTYHVHYKKSFEKYYKSIPVKFHEQIKKSISDLAFDPRPEGYIKLKGRDNEYRIRIGDYRVIYSIQDEKLYVLAMKLGQRNFIYK